MKAQCKAKKRNGERCRQPPMLGSAVCRMHGGAAPQVREAARRRIQELVMPSLATLARAADSKRKGIPTPVEIAAARDILDRAGYGGNEVKVSSEQGGITVVVRSVLQPADEVEA